MMNPAVKRNPVIDCTVRVKKPSIFKRIGKFLASMFKTRETTKYNLPPEMDSRLYL